MLSTKRTIDYGDNVIVYISKDNLIPITIQEKEHFNCQRGSFEHGAFVGKTYGSKVWSKPAKERRSWVIALPVSSSLWSLACPRRTEILHLTDISLTLLQLNLKPGSIVLESGTGSCSMSIHFIQTIAPSGHLYTFEFHEQRANAANETFQKYNLSPLVTVACRDVCSLGFGLDEIADAGFLDLPSPWNAINHVKRSLKPGGKLCCFSPCIEQVQKTCLELESGFEDVMTVECLLRTWNASKGSKKRKRSSEDLDSVLVSRPQALTRNHTGYLTFARRALKIEPLAKDEKSEQINK
eukprot:TRINITY_DN3387_c0_g1_i3.p1 TRINITY_DN3387_c0_g1~~TRINITY_DN3387_c0_g1_i3.p1  ORF type:complete len:296 (+),score=34.91 TRINITY_DN3387_c0_g1_i3:80-967(+)